ncbi:Transposase protein, partial [Thalictrum thalictroides]
AQYPNKAPPTRRWFQSWLQSHLKLHTTKTKPIANARLDTHTEEEVIQWFGKLEFAMAKYKIKNPKNILNMDESGARVGYPTGEQVIVPLQVKDLYTASPENRKSVTILETIYADGREPLPPFIIAPGVNIMENWITKELKGPESICCTPTGYINNEKIMEYADHLIKHTRAGPKKPWKILLLDSHESHCYEPFQLKCTESHIYLFYFPSHLTHALQPLDVGIFRPWKHYHNLAIQAALRSLDFEYTITSFFRDLTKIRTQTFKQYTIVNAFRTSGIYPVCQKAGLTKMREYKKNYKKRKADEMANTTEDREELQLPQLPTRDIMWEATARLAALGEKDPTQFSDNTLTTFKDIVKESTIQLYKAHLTTLEHSALQEKIRADSKRKRTSRRSIQKGGGASTTEDLRERIKIREEKESSEAFRKAEKKLATAVNKAKNSLHARGVQARRDEKARKERLKLYILRNELPLPEDIIPIRDPEKKPTVLEQSLCTEEAFPELLVQVQEARSQARFVEVEKDLLVRLGDHYEEVIRDYEDSEPEPEDYSTLKDSSDVESDSGSIDSIANQADFMPF